MNKTQLTHVDVALPVPFAETLTYVVPEALQGQVVVGMRVDVRVQQRKCVGVVVGRSDPKAVEQLGRLAHLVACPDPEPLLDPSMITWLRWVAGYYHHPLGQVVHTALPQWFRTGQPWLTQGLTDRLQWQVDAGSVRSEAQRRVQALCEDAGGVVSVGVLLASGVGMSTLEALQRSGHLVDAPERLQAVPPPLPMNLAQQAAHSAVIEHKGFGVFLLEGVTGSGKTRVYTQLIRDVVQRGQQVLLLLPEIGLTPQSLARLQAAGVERMVVLHSELANRHRAAAWCTARAGLADVVVGTRSALFTPMPRLGLVVVDESHDLALKQTSGLRYHARDVAIKRAQLCGCPVVLGTATPSLESWWHAEEGRYHRLRLTERATGAAAPRWQCVDVRAQRLVSGLAPAVWARMEEVLAAGHQVLLFLNRRGFAPVLLCHQCGWMADCKACDAHMTWHTSEQRLHCHHCGAVQAKPETCGHCACPTLVPVGWGTQRLEEALQERFPDVPVTRVDSDTIQRKAALEETLGRLATQAEPHIVVGTQMVAKGHHLPYLALVVLVDADALLYSPDFRGTEYLAQSVIQVAGRAGRADVPGDVWVQTRMPEHPCWRTLLTSGYSAWLSTLVAQREAAGWPPFAHLAQCHVQSRCPERLDRLCQRLEQAFPRWVAAGVRVVGPLPAWMPKQGGWHRAHCLMQAPTRAPLHQTLASLRAWLTAHAAGERCQWSLDVDPVATS